MPTCSPYLSIRNHSFTQPATSHPSTSCPPTASHLSVYPSVHPSTCPSICPPSTLHLPPPHPSALVQTTRPEIRVRCTAVHEDGTRAERKASPASQPRPPGQRLEAGRNKASGPLGHLAGAKPPDARPPSSFWSCGISPPNKQTRPHTQEETACMISADFASESNFKNLYSARCPYSVGPTQPRADACPRHQDPHSVGAVQLQGRMDKSHLPGPSWAQSIHFL